MQSKPLFSPFPQGDTPQIAAVPARHKPEGQHPNLPTDFTDNL